MRNNSLNACYYLFIFSLVVSLTLTGCNTDTLDEIDFADSKAVFQSLVDENELARLRIANSYCDYNDLQEMEIGTQAALGDFVVDFGDDISLSVTHINNPSHIVFQSPVDASALEAAQTDFLAEEHQGSFHIEENITKVCSMPIVLNAHRNDDTLVLQGTFADADDACKSLRFSMSLCEIRSGHLGLGVTTSDPQFDLITLRTSSTKEERIYGMGEQAPHDTLNLKGRAIPVLAQEGGVGRGHFPISKVVNGYSPGSAGSESTTYYAAAHYFTNSNRSFMLENTEYAEFDFRAENEISIRLFGTSLMGRILVGDDPLELIESFTEYAGRMPPLPEWANQGAIVALARPLKDSLQIVDKLRAHGAQISGVWNQTWSGISKTFIGEQVLWNWIQNPIHHPGWGEFVTGLETRGIRTLCYVNSMFRDVPEEAGPVRRNLFKEGVENGYFVRNEKDDVYMLPITAFEVGLLDLTNPDARDWMKDIIVEELIENAGCSGWMADFAEALPFNAVLKNGQSAASYHNQYPVDWIKLNRDAITEAGKMGEIMVFNRSGHTRTPAHALLLWQGDQLTTWDKYDGLANAIHGLINGGLSGIALNHSDVGGYTSLKALKVGYSRESELLKRWTEMSAFTTALRTHEGNQPGTNAQIYSDEEAMKHFARFTKVYKALSFYRQQLFEEANKRGWPVVRHLMLHYPDDDQAHQVDDQFLLGKEILVAPIKNKCRWPLSCAYNKKVYFPAGKWVHLWSGEIFGSEKSGQWGNVKAPIGEPAVFYREGSKVGARFITNLRELGISVADPRYTVF